MRAGSTFLWAALAAAIGTGLFLLKYEVQDEEQRLHALRKDIAGAKEEIHVLKAEWSYLNEPLRLKEQAEHHLGLHPLKPGQITSIDQLPMADQASAAPQPPAPARPPQAPAKAAAPPAKPPASAPYSTAKAEVHPPAKPLVALPPDGVMVITSPAMLEPDVASVRRHP